mmetsp:Transcript_472/g.846  ORF Transcript_472/g.846 Transcript_472/m.846 type:complete len:116 (+) Transcript_472:412-759(+)
MRTLKVSIAQCPCDCKGSKNSALKDRPAVLFEPRSLRRCGSFVVFAQNHDFASTTEHRTTVPGIGTIEDAIQHQTDVSTRPGTSGCRSKKLDVRGKKRVQESCLWIASRGQFLKE